MERSKSIWFKKAVSQLTKYRKQLTLNTIDLVYSGERWIISYERTIINSRSQILETGNNQIQVTMNEMNPMFHIDLLQK